MVLNDCVCPGHELRLECTVVGVGSTNWRGSAIDCQEKIKELVLRHTGFENGTSSSCNNGRIIGRSINTTSSSDGIKYISQLIIQLDVNATQESRTVECTHDSGAQEIIIDTHNISYTRGKKAIHITIFYSKVSVPLRQRYHTAGL